DEATRNAREALEAKENEGAQRQLAEAKAQESRQRLVQLHVANGTRLLDDGDLLGALPWLTEALALDQGDRSREERHRTRIAAVLAQTPRLVRLWDHDHEVEYAAFSPDGRRIVTASRDHTARVWDVGTGVAPRRAPPAAPAPRPNCWEGRVHPGRPARRPRQPRPDGAGVGREQRTGRRPGPAARRRRGRCVLQPGRPLGGHRQHGRDGAA